MTNSYTLFNSYTKSDIIIIYTRYISLWSIETPPQKTVDFFPI